MKFGETFAQRSVPEWAAFNLNYNGIKDVVKQNTSRNHGGPVYIPRQGKSRWEDSDTALFELLKNQHANISLFLRMKQGEIDRRLVVLTRQIAALRAYADEKALQLHFVASMQGRKHRRLSTEIEQLGDLIQKVARFASAQRIAFRKLIKKYTKWTGSTSLQTRMDVEVFSSQQLKTDYSDYLQELAEQRTILTEELAVPILRKQQADRLAKGRQQGTASTTSTRSLIAEINSAVKQAPAAFDTALMAVPYGEAAGSAVYWVHPDNLDEARILLHRNMKRLGSVSSSPSRANSQESLTSPKSTSSTFSPDPTTHMVCFDNAHRFIADKSSTRPSKIALSAYWTCDKDAAVSLTGLSPTSPGGQTVLLERDDLSIALDRNSSLKDYSPETSIIQQYLIEHRDVKPLALVRAHRSRYSGLTNTGDVANWATLDNTISVGTVDISQLGKLQSCGTSGDAFPYAVLHIRWEFARMPAVVRAFDESHLAFKVDDFTIEDMAIRKVQPDLPRAVWQPQFEQDITKLPPGPVPNLNRLKSTSRMNFSTSDISGTSSGPSSNEGRTDSVFSATTRGYSSATSEETRAVTVSSPLVPEARMDRKPNKKRARVVVPEPEPSFRYWNEFDDGDSDVNPQDSYAIYVDPDEPMFPAMSQAWAALKASWPLKLFFAETGFGNERMPLLYEEEDGSAESSDSESFIEAQQQELRRGLVWGLVGGISLTFLIGVAVLAFCIFSLA